MDAIDIDATWHWTCRLCPPVDGIVPGAYGTGDTRLEVVRAARAHAAAAHPDVDRRMIA